MLLNSRGSVDSVNFIFMKSTLAIALTSTLLALGATPTHALTLYDGALGTPPNSQGWSSSLSTATQTSNTTGTTLNTTAADSIQAGYSRFGLSLNRTTGYTFQFKLQVLSEDHSNPNAQNNTGTDAIADRAGLSIIALSSDGRGIELGFWNNEIWAQADGAVKADPLTAPTGTRFTHAEGAAFNTQSAMNQYDLSILGNTYLLYANGSLLLTGNLRNYTPEGLPYTTPNFLFIGDNTTSANASFKLAQVDFSPTPVPFAFNPLLGLGIVGLSKARRALRRRNVKSAVVA